MKKYIAPCTITVPMATEGLAQTSVHGPDDDFNNGLGGWEEGLEQGVRGQQHQAEAWDGVMTREEW